METINIKPLTTEAFAPFGQVLETPGNANRLDGAATLFSGRAHAKPNLALVRAKPRALPLVVELMERHQHSSQAFTPLDAASYLVLVCPSTPDDTPDVARLRAFTANAHQGINYNAGTWHHPMTALGAPAVFAMTIWEDGGDGDCQFYHLDPGLQVTITSP
jgi:ureidoglycolate lyase